MDSHLIRLDSAVKALDPSASYFSIKDDTCVHTLLAINKSRGVKVEQLGTVVRITDSKGIVLAEFFSVIPEYKISEVTPVDPEAIKAVITNTDTTRTFGLDPIKIKEVRECNLREKEPIVADEPELPSWVATELGDALGITLTGVAFEDYVKLAKNERRARSTRPPRGPPRGPPREPPRGSPREPPREPPRGAGWTPSTMSYDPAFGGGPRTGEVKPFSAPLPPPSRGSTRFMGYRPRRFAGYPGEDAKNNHHPSFSSKEADAARVAYYTGARAVPPARYIPDDDTPRVVRGFRHIPKEDNLA